ncbi:hypothetical protein KC332_g4252 [Hortaea werneckii]|nr:hypothetical protein KC350_g14195 [Hortaea werneckii]KAI6815195.1 hypothetical protein KC358_g10996 [Hortaea werneckii]KAI6924584.1 hypothetical protein KC341_g13943 [Hortaea werneckii]KAI6942783.1 hypothetical protein KC348_g4389 [Hortaea werneckii]KAI6967195.1 hypothetical protein KC321_g9158 [Hortaea werneckii]
MKKAATASAGDMTNGDVSRLTSFPPLERTGDNEDSVTCVENVVDSMAKTEIKEADVMDGGVESTSRPPSPPSGARTPSLRLEECPSRLRPQIPPPNYGAVKPGVLFRSAFPQDRNLEFLEGLNIRTILSFVATEPSEHYTSWLRTSAITRMRIDIAPNKDGHVHTTWDSLCEALLLVLDSANYPLYLHCNQGRHRTGCVIACLRKIQRWPLDAVLAEYRVYASPKARDGDIELIKAFDPDVVFDYAKARGYLDPSPRKQGQQHHHHQQGGFFMKRMDSTIADIDALAEALASHGGPFGDGGDGAELLPTSSRVSSTTGSLFSSASDEEALEMRHSMPTVIGDGPQAAAYSATDGTSMDGRSDRSSNVGDGTGGRRAWDYESPPHAGGGGGEGLQNFSSSSSDYERDFERDGGWENTTATVTELADDAMTPPPDVEGMGDPFGDPSSSSTTSS